MNKKSFKVVLEAARQANIKVDTITTGVDRVSASIAGKSYAGKTAAINAITSEYLKRR